MNLSSFYGGTPLAYTSLLLLLSLNKSPLLIEHSCAKLLNNSFDFSLLKKNLSNIKFDVLLCKLMALNYIYIEK